MFAVGVDGYKGGWVGVGGGPGGWLEIAAVPTFAALLQRFESTAVFAVDIPIGLPVREARAADNAARALLGPRRSSLFETPPRQVFEAASYAEARAVSVAARGKSVSAQAYNLGAKVLEVDAHLPDSRLYEVHPELSFFEMAGGRPCAHPKKTWVGLCERRELLSRAGVDVPAAIEGDPSVPVDDVVDAAAAYWTARRIVDGAAVPVPDPPELLGGRATAIWR